MGRKRIAANQPRKIKEIVEYDIDEEVHSFSVRRHKDKTRVRKTAAATNNASARLKKIEIEPRTDNQRQFLELLADKTVTFGVGCAGTGKSFLAV